MLPAERLVLVAIALVLCACTAGCAGGSDRAAREQTSTAVGTRATPAESSKTIECLDAAGLSDVRERAPGLWGGVHHEPAYALVVHKLMKPASVPRVVAGEYALAGSFKVVAVGRGFIGNEGIQADALVQSVADCLGG